MSKSPFLQALSPRALAMTLGLVVFLIMSLVTYAAPTEIGMGHIQRIVYIHVSVAWFSMFAFVWMTGAGMLYLVQRDLKWEAWSQAAAEVGWLCCGLTLATGSIWAREAWGTWWTWDPRLTTAFVLWMIYSGILLMRHSIIDLHARARICAILSLLGVADIPFVIMATRWFRGIHPVSPEMEPTMRWVLFGTIVCTTAYLALVLAKRQSQLRQELASKMPCVSPEHVASTRPV